MAVNYLSVEHVIVSISLNDRAEFFAYLALSAHFFVHSDDARLRVGGDYMVVNL